MVDVARQRFGRYETLFPIASGGMAEVYVARALGEAGFQKIVALKRIRPELAGDARFVTMFLDEGRVAANITSPHVVSTLDLGRAEDNSVYLVMELVTGVSLQTLIFESEVDTSPMPLPIAIDIAVQAAQGLHDAHEATSPTGEPLDLVHRDCSPHNVLVDVKGQVRITDFGIMKALERQTESQAGEMKGKLAYLSPEQARGLPVDRRTDIFILGIVAWEMIAGQQLFVARHTVEALYKIGAMPIPPLSEVRPEVSPEIAAVVAQALEREPEKRFATAGAFGNALLNAVGGKAAPRAQIAALVRKRGGEALAGLERGIKEALLKKDAPPPAFEPRPAPKPAADAPFRLRKKTTPLGSPDQHAEPIGLGSPKTAPLGTMVRGDDAYEPLPLSTPRAEPLGITWQEAPEDRVDEEPEPIPLKARARTPTGPELPANTAFPEPESHALRNVAIAGLLIAAGIGAAVAAVWYF